MTHLRICLDARLTGGTAGGLEQVAIGMASGLSRLTDGDEEYLFLAYPDADEWLRPYVTGPCRMLHGPPVPRPSPAKRQLLRIPGVRWLWDYLSPLMGDRSFNVPRSDGTAEQSGAEVIHFLHQRGFLTRLPNVYQPHDLQHIHLPQYFNPRHRAGRDFLFRTMCAQATMVAVTAGWGKRDLIRQYGIDERKISVVPWAPPIEAYPKPSAEDIVATRAKLGLPDDFILFPAQTFPHKNHLGLLEALAKLRDRRGLVVPLVCSGRMNTFYPTIARRVERLGLKAQVRFVGFVSPLELQCLYKLSRAMVIPTKFEAASFPVWEAFLAEVPVACSNVTSLPEQAGDAAVIFDPDSDAAIADAVASLWENAELRQKLVCRGRRRVTQFTWDRTARTFRAHYRRLAGRPLIDEDAALLSLEPLI